MGSLDIPFPKKILTELKDPGAQPPARQGHGEDRRDLPGTVRSDFAEKLRYRAGACANTKLTGAGTDTPGPTRARNVTTPCESRSIEGSSTRYGNK
jgi:hypothetical protein